ncbi:unnamed protein product, partial [Closterium sp. Naga37s-1]
HVGQTVAQSTGRRKGGATSVRGAGDGAGEAAGDGAAGRRNNEERQGAAG